MFTKTKIPLIAFIILISAVSSYAQQKEMKQAALDFGDLQFNTAAKNYEKAISKFKEDSPQKHYAIFMLGECYRLMNEPDKAGKSYEELIPGDFGNTNPTLYLRYASVLRTQGKLAEAKTYYKKYIQEDPFNQQGKNGLKSCEWIQANEKKRAQVNITNHSAINSSHDDFAPAFYSRDYDKIVFTSNRNGATGMNNDQWTGAKFSDLFLAVRSHNTWDDPVLFEKKGMINTDINEGAPCFTSDLKTLYFTRCDRMDDKKHFCQILKTTGQDSTWTEPIVVFSDTSSNMGQPTLSEDELTIIFASDKKSGNGGNDLWIAKRENKDRNFGEPTNLGTAINTGGDEMFPYLFKDTLLYFASDGLPGYGGLDLFKSSIKNNAYSVPENLLVPVNSGYDDFGIIVKIPGEEGYFSSNRPGGEGGDDLYQFTRRILLFTAAGKVKDNMTLLSMEGVHVLLINEAKDTVQLLTDPLGNFRFDTAQVTENQAYDLVVKQNNYFASKIAFATKLYREDHDFYFNIVLEPIPEAPIVLPDILYELDKWDLLPQYQDSLTQLVDLLKVNENLVIELRSHTDSRASDEYNDVLSQKRAQSVVDFLVSKGIDPGRLVAKGYGERVPRVLTGDMVRENYLFKKGTELNDRFVNALPTKEIQEAAYQLNRRTEFAVLAKDYKPGQEASNSQMPVIELVSDTSVTKIDYTLTPTGKMEVEGYINDYGVRAVFDPENPESLIDERIVMDLLKKGAINRNDFQGNFDEIVVNDHLIENSVLKLTTMRIGGAIIRNSMVRVKPDTRQLLVMGKDMMAKVPAYKVDEEKKQIIFK